MGDNGPGLEWGEWQKWKLLRTYYKDLGEEDEREGGPDDLREEIQMEEKQVVGRRLPLRACCVKHLLHIKLNINSFLDFQHFLHSSFNLIPDLISGPNSCFYPWSAKLDYLLLSDKDNFHLCCFAHDPFTWLDFPFVSHTRRWSVFKDSFWKHYLILMNVCSLFSTFPLLISLSSHSAFYIAASYVSFLLIFLF